MGDNDSETLVSVTMAQWDFEDDAFDEISDDAKNFIETLLVKDMRWAGFSWLDVMMFSYVFI